MDNKINMKKNKSWNWFESHFDLKTISFFIGLALAIFLVGGFIKVLEFIPKEWANTYLIIGFIIGILFIAYLTKSSES